MATIIDIDGTLQVDERELTFSASRAQGPGGQHVNKTASAVTLRFCISSSSLSDAIKHRLLQLEDHRIRDDGVVVIKAQASRSQHRNKQAAIERLADLLKRVATPPRLRKPTKPSAASKRKRLAAKRDNAARKRLRRRPHRDDIN
ncbi:MAG: alternative ribosome rescue aminoacyl-tRNA hydrolase ArfB [Pseudomonadota bacterium]